MRPLILCLWFVTTMYESHGFLSHQPPSSNSRWLLPKLEDSTTTTKTTAAPTTTALGVWWFGGSPTEQSVGSNEESCELVAVRIERPTSNSRKIFGEIVVPAPLDDVWAILTDYDRLAIHVPNLVESRVTQKQSDGEQGDGNYRCRLFQRGAQKIVGFEFGASVTMDMKEFAKDLTFELPPANTGANHNIGGQRNRERRIEFKCTDSFFFNEFDGEWKVTEQTGPIGEPETLLSYVVDVKPKGPVPVAALEWRIREDVPTNLRAVKKASVEVGLSGVQAARVPKRLPPSSMSSNNGMARTTPALNGQRPADTRVVASSDIPTSPSVNGKAATPAGVASSPQRNGRTAPTRNGRTAPTRNGRSTSSGEKKPRKKLERVMVQWEPWEENETMARYLDLDDNQQ